MREERERERNRKGGSRMEDNERGRRGRVRREEGVVGEKRDQQRKGGRMGKEGIKSCIKNSPNNCYVDNQIYKSHIHTNTH